MKRLTILLSLVTLCCAALLFAGGTTRGAGGAAETGKKYIIHLKDGGKLKTDNYSVEKGMVKIFLPSGAISLDKKMIKSIEEVSGEEGSTMQKVFQPPVPKKEPEKKGGTSPSSERPTAPTPGRARSYELTDDNGHTEGWWKKRVADWKKRLEDAQTRYAAAKKEWDDYNGVLNGQQSVQVQQRAVQNVLGIQSTLNGKPIPKRQVVLGVVTTTFVGTPSAQFDITKYQDLRGSARVKMDTASADIAEAQQMLDETLPDEARLAGAPPGWVR